MKKTQIEASVKEQFGTNLHEYIRQKVEIEALYDYEIAPFLRVGTSTIRRLRTSFGIKKANGFNRRFESSYGEGAVEEFKNMIEDPNNSLADVGRRFVFSREYARQAYYKIYGCSYSETLKRKRGVKKITKPPNGKSKSQRMADLQKVSEKVKSMRLNATIENNGHSYIVLNNGYKIDLRISSTPVKIGKKQYFRINVSKCATSDFDFFICLCRNEKEDTYFIIPSNEMPGSNVLLSPQSNPDQSKYARFLEAWPLLNHKNWKDNVKQ
jgi:hypothetical protein